jgi:hypothetical protein
MKTLTVRPETKRLLKIAAAAEQIDLGALLDDLIRERFLRTRDTLIFPAAGEPARAA